MAFDPNNSRLFDPVTGSKLPVLKHVVFTPGVDSTFAHPIHLQYVRDPVRGLGVQVIEECGVRVERVIHVFFGVQAGVFPQEPVVGAASDPRIREVLTTFELGCQMRLDLAGRPCFPAVGERKRRLSGMVVALRPEPVVAEPPKDARGNPLPLKLVQLHHFPADTWVGRAVFAPCGQTGDVPTWVDTNDEPPQDVSEDWLPGPHPAYDVGVVTSYEPDPNFADLGHMRVHFVGSHGSTLHYTSWNLWTPVEVP